MSHNFRVTEDTAWKNRVWRAVEVRTCVAAVRTERSRPRGGPVASSRSPPPGRGGPVRSVCRDQCGLSRRADSRPARASALLTEARVAPPPGPGPGPERRLPPAPDCAVWSGSPARGAGPRLSPVRGPSLFPGLQPSAEFSL